MTDERPERCETCKFWRDGPDDQTCHRHAPEPVRMKSSNEGVYIPLWPLMEADEWCGEWQPLPGRQTPPLAADTPPAG